MCCFAGARHVDVSGTNIFGRMLDTAGHQVLAYAMSLSVDTEVAMVLPLPVMPGAGEDALRFIDLHSFPDMFRDLAGLFVPPMMGPGMGRGPVAAQGLAVHQVGSFVASYVPTRADFARLDPRFRIADALFDAVPVYADYGFAVFQLAPGRTTVHPMAFSFPTRHPDYIYFPTVHVHDGRFHSSARFDHALYYQHERAFASGGRFGKDQISFRPAQTNFLGVVAANDHLVRRELRGTFVNEDVWIPTA